MERELHYKDLSGKDQSKQEETRGSGLGQEQMPLCSLLPSPHRIWHVSHVLWCHISYEIDATLSTLPRRTEVK